MKERFYLYVHTTEFCPDFKVLTTLFDSIITHAGRGGVKGRLLYLWLVYCPFVDLSRLHFP